MFALLLVAVLGLAGVTAYFAVFGLSALAPAVPQAMMALGVSLETAKYAAAVFTYAHWDTLSRRLRYALVTSTATVMLLTSIGVFGYLQAAFAPGLTTTELQAQTITELQARKTELQAQLDSVDAETKRVPDNVVRARIALLREYAERRAVIDKELQETRAALSAAQVKVVEARAHTGPLSYVASALGVPVDRAVFYMSVLLTASLDPLAMLLSLSLTHVRPRRRDQPLRVVEPGPVSPAPAADTGADMQAQPYRRSVLGTVLPPE